MTTAMSLFFVFTADEEDTVIDSDGRQERAKVKERKKERDRKRRRNVARRASSARKEGKELEDRPEREERRGRKKTDKEGKGKGKGGEDERQEEVKNDTVAKIQKDFCNENNRNLEQKEMEVVGEEDGDTEGKRKNGRSKKDEKKEDNGSGEKVEKKQKKKRVETR